MTALHILFHPSAAIDLRRALEYAGSKDRVIAFPDDLSFGPINPPEALTRAKWIDQVLGYSGWEALEPGLEAFWAEALADHPDRVVWLSRRSTLEFCGFLEWLRRNGESPFKLIDLTNVELPHDGASGRLVLAPITSLVSAKLFSGARLWDLAAPLAEETRQKWLSQWDNLVTEDAPIRVLEPEGPKSARLDVFDDQILGYVGEDWGKAARAVGYFLYETTYEGFCPAGVHQTGDMVPIARIAALIGVGKIEARGDPFELQNCTIRRSTRQVESNPGV